MFNWPLGCGCVSWVWFKILKTKQFGCGVCINVSYLNPQNPKLKGDKIMKKRAKIITTIASLCLAVALMAFGVYAAQTASMGITSSVTFTAVDVKVQWTVGVTRGNGTTSTTLFDPTQAANIFTFETETGAGQTESQNRALMLSDPESGDPTPINFVSDGGRVITYTFTCTNLSTKQDVVIAIGSNPSYFTDEANVLTCVYEQGLSTASLSTNSGDSWTGVAQLAHGATYVFKVTLTLVDVTSDIDPAVQALNVVFNTTKYSA
jgi:hypothetical protein